MPLPLSEIFPDADYRFHLTLRKGDVAEFFRGRDEAVLAERREWLQQDASAYALVENGATALVDEFAALAGKWGAAEVSALPASRAPAATLCSLGAALVPDFLLLAPDASGAFRLQAGAVCFPTAWALAEKMGLTLDAIHGVVPGLNPVLASPIGQFLSRLKPDQAYERANWGLAATLELNLHPALNRPRLQPDTPAAQIWLRIEDQLLAALPVTGGVLFAIRLRVFPLLKIIEDLPLKRGLHRALATMTPELAAYKGLALIRDRLLALTA